MFMCDNVTMNRGDRVTLEWPETVVTEFITGKKMLQKREVWTGTIKTIGGGTHAHRTAAVDFEDHGLQFVPLGRLRRITG